MKAGILSLVLLCLVSKTIAQDKAPEICGQLNKVINSTIHRFAEIKTSDKESNITLDGFPQNGYIDLDEKTYVEWGSRDEIFKKKKEMEAAFADYITKISACHFDAATFKVKFKVANECEFDATPTSDPKLKTVKLHIVSGEKNNHKGQYYIYIMVTNDYFETGTENKSELEEKENEDNALHKARADSFKYGINALLAAAPDSFKTALGAEHKDMVGTTYDCTIKLPGAENVFFRDELDKRTYNATFYEGFDSINAEKIYKSVVNLLNKSLPAGYMMEDHKNDNYKHDVLFKANTENAGKPMIKLLETVDQKTYYILTMEIKDM